ncbi:hypothetical protein [Couchioplanes caeruleus]|uniref:Uncharacterized protein n=2 Tax=Couchioplanes caeruleus TaxID=56438 RepID=A0A1K0FCR0_9ACTN|nr:hypothetical protein [Couchioplanes caeruleus]OJF10536.1 hypothetical protein BG844_31470 [Couchioplanes caeruleus subsp. caeruleus]ROP28631.1 hypothetical protein EDD30_1397 [Couchioplanes caeruleus]
MRAAGVPKLPQPQMCRGGRAYEVKWDGCPEVLADHCVDALLAVGRPSELLDRSDTTAQLLAFAAGVARSLDRLDLTAQLGGLGPERTCDFLRGCTNLVELVLSPHAASKDEEARLGRVPHA